MTAKTKVRIAAPIRTDQEYRMSGDFVSLPAPPPGIAITGNRADTDPQSLPIRSKEDWLKADKLLRGVVKRAPQ